MRKPIIALAVAVLATGTLPAVAGAQHAAMSVKYTIKLNGKFEKPAKGDPKGSGTAVIRIDTGKKTVCYSFKVKGIKLPAEAAHIHRGKKGVSGPIVVALSAPKKNGKASGCVHHVSASLVNGMTKHPALYYVNVHTSKYPGGAIRGQL